MVIMAAVTGPNSRTGTLPPKRVNKEGSPKELSIFNKCIENGKLRADKKIEIWGKELPFQGEDTYTYIPDKGETFGKLKEKFGLPDGTFKEKLFGFPGDKDTYIIGDSFPKGIKIPKAALHEAIGKK